ncbi:MAG: protein kinase [Myxococcales bacterium]|nr:protein kinase [Myxococcales bacterium]USN50885.1 MAG: protein kinase [Myxococcales bacterium]
MSLHNDGIAKNIFEQRHLLLVTEFLNQGGQATLYKGRILPHYQDIILKIYNDRSQAKREAKALCALKHPCIPAYQGYCQVKESLGIILDYFPAKSFRQVIKSKLSLEHIRSITRQLLEILAYIHSTGIYHNDLSPDNLLWQQHKGSLIIDFGAASFGPLSSSFPFGQTCYLAPEILFGAQTSHLSDLYSLGTILFECITMQSFNPAKMYRSFRLLEENVTGDQKDLFYLIKALLAPTPRLRPKSAQKILDVMQWQQVRDPPLLMKDNEETKIISHSERMTLIQTTIDYIPLRSNTDDRGDSSMPEFFEYELN